MGKSLKAGLLLASTLLLVACGSSEPTGSADTTSKESVTTETVEEIDAYVPSYSVIVSETADGGKGYTLQGEEDERGWAVIHSIEVDADGKIVASDFNYINEEGKLKTDDAEYVAKMEEGSGNNLPKTVEYLNNYLVENNSLEGLEDEGVDVVSGASSTLDLFLETSDEILGQMVAE